jgi:hypothetical protein
MLDKTVAGEIFNAETPCRAWVLSDDMKCRPRAVRRFRKGTILDCLAMPSMLRINATTARQNERSASEMKRVEKAKMKVFVYP